MQNKRIMIVEDESIVARDIGKALESFGYEVSYQASTGEAAVRQAEEHRPDLILMDIKLKGEMDGVEAAGLIRSRCNIPVVYLTSYADDALLERAKTTAPFGYLTKPFDDQSLKITVMMACYKAEMESKLATMAEHLEKSNRELRISKESFHNIVVNDSNGIVVTSKNGTIRFVNPAAKKLFNRENDELLGEQFGVPITVSDLSMEVDIVRKGGTRGLGEMLIIETEWEGESANLILIRDITDRKMYEESLIKTAEKLKKLDEMKSDFISIASHELRTPMTSIKNAVDLILQGKTGAVTPEQEKFLTMAQRNITRLNALINDMLNIAKIESGKMKYQYTRMDIREIIDRVIHLLQPSADLKSITLNSEISPDLPDIHGDANKIEEVLINLIGNAIKFTPVHGFVTIAVQQREAPADRPEEAPGYVEISVADTGIGIPEEHKEHLFEKFYQVRHPLTRQDQKGTGLGLAICKGIIEGHKGEIWCETAEGAGSTFYFALPVFAGEP